MSDLTTQFLYRTWAGSSATGDDKKLAQIITAVSDSVSRFCNREFALTTYRRWYNGTGQNWILVPHWPITALYGVGYLTREVITVGNTAHKYASISTELTGVRLFSSSAGTETDTGTILYATYPTLTTLAAAIVAVTGWTASVATGYGDYASNMVKPGMVGNVANGDTFDLEICDDFVNARIASLSDRMIELASPMLRAGFDPQMSTAFPEGWSNIFAWYKAGYTLPVDDARHTALATTGNLPDGLVGIVNNIVKAVYDAAGQTIGTAASEAIGDYSYSMDTAARAMLDTMISESAAVLSPYRSFGVE